MLSITRSFVIDVMSGNANGVWEVLAGSTAFCMYQHASEEPRSEYDDC
jgi:hypothetical protein